MQAIDVLTFGVAGLIAHEIAHVVAALACKVKVYEVGVSWRGPYIRREVGTSQQNLTISLAGPGINLLFALALYKVLPSFAICNLVLAFSNLLPISGSDGLRAWYLVRDQITRPGISPHVACSRKSFPSESGVLS